MKKKYLSVIIPLYNEESRLSNLVTIHKYLNSRKFSWQIILINDGSKDKTNKTAKKILKSHALKNTQLISYSKNMGKGFAIKTGMLIATGKYRLFTDIDLSTSIDEFNKFLPHLEKFGVVLGSRKMHQSRVIVHQSRLREKMGKGFTKLSQLVLQLNTSDFTCGFKCFSENAAEKIFEKQTISRWGFDSEILFLAKKFKIKVKEIPVKWSNNPHSRVKFPEDIITSLTDLIRIRFNDFRKTYS